MKKKISAQTDDRATKASKSKKRHVHKGIKKTKSIISIQEGSKVVLNAKDFF